MSFPNIDRAMIGTLQELMLRENNRQRAAARPASS